MPCSKLHSPARTALALAVTLATATTPLLLAGCKQEGASAPSAEASASSAADAATDGSSQSDGDGSVLPEDYEVQSIQCGRVLIDVPVQWESDGEPVPDKLFGVPYISVSRVSSGSLSLVYEGNSQSSESPMLIMGYGDLTEEPMSWRELFSDIQDFEKDVSSQGSNSPTKFSWDTLNIGGNRVLKVSLAQPTDRADNSPIMHSRVYFFEKDNQLAECVSLVWYEGWDAFLESNPSKDGLVSWELEQPYVNDAILEAIESSITLQ